MKVSSACDKPVRVRTASWAPSIPTASDRLSAMPSASANASNSLLKAGDLFAQSHGFGLGDEADFLIAAGINEVHRIISRVEILVKRARLRCSSLSQIHGQEAPCSRVHVTGSQVSE